MKINYNGKTWDPDSAEFLEEFVDEMIAEAFRMHDDFEKVGLLMEDVYFADFASHVVAAGLGRLAEHTTDPEWVIYEHLSPVVLRVRELLHVPVLVNVHGNN